MTNTIGPPFDGETAKRAVVTVGHGGRGFVMELTQPMALSDDAKREGLQPFLTRRIVLTAAHCLPELPPANPWAAALDRTYEFLLGALGDSAPSIWAECIFVDPVADIAVLGAPDEAEQELVYQAEAFEAFVASAGALFAANTTSSTRVWRLSLDGRWTACQIESGTARTLSFTEREEPVESGMSGSPLLLDTGIAIGLVSTGKDLEPRLLRCLPEWMVEQLT